MSELSDGGGEAQGIPSSYSRMVGERLRAIRRQKRLSLQDVEATSRQEFKASVLGAYERGERAISVPRLQRLARFYNVPVDQLLPPDEGPDFPGSDGFGGAAKVAIDLGKLDTMRGPEFEMLNRFLRTIQVQRGDFNGRVLTIRAADLPAVASMIGTSLELIVPKLDELGLRYVRPPAE